MRKLTVARAAEVQRALAFLPPEFLNSEVARQAGRNGEELATDEAAVWKRVLNYRIAQFLQPARVLETHGGIGLSRALFEIGAPGCRVCSPTDFRKIDAALAFEPFDLIDVDPFGQPWEALEIALPLLETNGVLMVSSGTASAVWRNLPAVRKFTCNTGSKMTLWIEHEYVPQLEQKTGLSARYFYGFPSTVRVILSQRELPASLFADCPRWMWWLARAAKNNGNALL